MIKSYIRICVAVLSLLLVMQSGLAAPETPVGHVVWVKGTFTAGSRVLQRFSPIYLYDVLTTDARSLAEIAFTDNTLMTFKENSQFSVDKYRFNPSTSGNFVGTLASGGFRTITGLIAKKYPGNYQVNTPVATMGVRGTDYQAIYKGGYLYVVAYKGTVCITPLNGSLPACIQYPCSRGLYNIMAQ